MEAKKPETGIGILADTRLDNDFFSDPARFMNRELSWLEFNRRVLEEASRPDIPLLERVRFLSISASNLDEFFMVRVAGLIGQIRRGVERPSDDGKTPRQQLDAVEQAIDALQKDQQDCWESLSAALAGERIEIIRSSDLSDEESAWLEEYFLSAMFPVLTPLSMDLAHPFPFIPNLGHALAYDLRKPGEDKPMTAFLRLPESMKRFIALPSRGEGETHFISVEDVIELFIDHLFPGYLVSGSGNFRIIRDSDLEVEEEAEDLVLTFETALKRRRRGSVIRLEIDSEMPALLRNYISSELNIDAGQVTLIDGMLALNNLSEVVALDRPDLKYEPYTARFPERVREQGGDCFAAIPPEGFYRTPPL